MATGSSGTVPPPAACWKAPKAEGLPTVSLYDGLVMARSAYNYNINHRSVMIFGKPEKLADAKKEAQLRHMVNRPFLASGTGCARCSRRS